MTAHVQSRGFRELGDRLTKSSAVWATSRQPPSIVSECPRFGIALISVTPGLRFCLIANSDGARARSHRELARARGDYAPIMQSVRPSALLLVVRSDRLR